MKEPEEKYMLREKELDNTKRELSKLQDAELYLDVKGLTEEFESWRESYQEALVEELMEKKYKEFKK